MPRYGSARRSSAVLISIKLFILMIAGEIAVLGQCTLSPDKNGGPSYNEPRGLVDTKYGQAVPRAWPQVHKVYYIENVGAYNTYVTSFPNDYIAAIIRAYGNWESSNTNAGLDLEFYGTSINGLASDE